MNFKDQLVDPEVDKKAVDSAIDWATSTANHHPEEPLPWTIDPASSWRRRLEEGRRRRNVAEGRQKAGITGWEVASAEDLGDPHEGIAHVAHRAPHADMNYESEQQKDPWAHIRRRV